MKRNPKGTKKQLLNRLRATRCYLKARREELVNGLIPVHGYKSLNELDAAIRTNQGQIDFLTGKSKLGGAARASALRKAGAALTVVRA